MPGKRGQKGLKPFQVPDQYAATFLEGMDRRSKAARALTARLQSLTNDLGGASALPYARLSLAKRAVFVEARLEALEAELAAGIDVDSTKYVALLNSLLGLFRTLGLRRVARDISLQDYIGGAS